MATHEAGRDALAAYRERRSPERTPEPFGGELPAGLGIFCVQKHAATRTHYDLRLELDGVLLSWAVPKGVSPDPADKRLAMHVEDHPLDYAEFEGVIPEGEYGAGPVILWDLGRWFPLEDPVEGMERGKLLFELRGWKLRGVWTLVRIEKGETGREWLLIREKKQLASGMAADAHPPDVSVLSGLEVEELDEIAAGRREAGGPVRKALEALASSGAGVARHRVEPEEVDLMLARTRRRPFSDSAWWFEVKLDGYRMLAARRPLSGAPPPPGAPDGPAVADAAGRARLRGRPLLLTRNGNDATPGFPEIARALRALPYRHVVLDGEVVVLDESGLPSFQALQGRAQLTRHADIVRASFERPATLYLFDLLGFGDFDLRGLPLRERRRLLHEMVPAAGPLRLSEHFEGAGEELYARVRDLGLEGIMAKRADAPYRGGRSSDWLKVHAPRTARFAIVGFTEPKGSRAGFGALHVAVCEPGPEDPPRLVYAGKVGTGFDDATLRLLRDRLGRRERATPPCEGPVPNGREDRWVEPGLVCRVRYKEWTDEGRLRAPVFEGLVEGASVRDCVRGALARGAAALADPAAAQRGAPPPDELELSNLDKVFWPDEGYTKGDLIEYYRRVAPWLLPYLRDRPLVLTRYPDGIDGKSFFQKDAPDHAPDWIRTEAVWSEGGGREIRYFIVNDVSSLLYLANLATIPLHLWASRLADLDRPDWCVIDLDPKEAPFEDVIEIARSTRALCREIGLPSFVKTSGSTGLHVLLPVAGMLNHDEARSLGELLARVVAAELPKIATLVRDPARREGKVYLDYVQNGRGRLVVAPYSVRPLPGAPVSAPLRWEEVRPGLRIRDFTIETLPERLERLEEDPMRPVLDERPDLMASLRGLQRRLEGS